MESLARGRIRITEQRALGAHLLRLRRQFESHMAAEEAVIYPMLAAALPEARSGIEPLREEHADLREMLANLVAWLERPAGHERDVQVGVEVRDFADLMRCHVRKEELLVFDVSERVLEARELRDLENRLAPFAATPRLRGGASVRTPHERSS